MQHPLHISEIIERVGELLAWSKNPNGSFSFQPKDLVACIKVSRQWRNTLTPVLWKVYHDGMTSHWRLTKESASLHTNFIRYIYLTSAPVLIPIHSAQLQQLTLVHKDRKLDALTLLCINKDLRGLEWLVPHSSASSPDKQLVRFSLGTLSRLTFLRIDCWRDSLLEDITSIALNNPNLKTMVFGSLISLKTKATNDTPPLSLTELRLESQWELNPGIEYLVRCCPRLSTLLFRADSTCPYSTLTQNLWECCPVLTTLRDVESFNHSQTGNMLCAGGIESLVQSSHFLMHLDMPVEHLTREICNTLQDRHSTSLRTVRLYLQSADEEDFMCVSDILSGCSNLTSFSLSYSNNDGDSLSMDTDSWMWKADDASAMFIVPWSCSRLETLELTGISPTCYFDDDVDVDDDDDDDSYESHTDNKSSNSKNDHNGSDQDDASDDQDDHQFSVSEESTQGMDLDTDSQWSFDIVMRDAKYNGVDKDGMIRNKDDSWMDVDPTPTELAFNYVLQCLEADAPSCFLDAFSDWLETLDWTLQTDVSIWELGVRHDYKRFLIELFERVSDMPNMDRVVMRGLSAVKSK
ncbi:MAG: hypothetical protein BYD32DRAFT_492091 [Podila humilis]|nr:MAG: hypothetical protein BYD32DRAFT_492091 [Podila humilis]